MKDLKVPERITEENLVELYKQMWTIRYFEEKVDQFFCER